MHPIYSIIKKDLLLAYRHRMELLNPVSFFVLVTMLFPLAVTSDPAKLMMMGPGMIWIALLLANMLTIENIFLADFEDGTLEQMVLNPTSLPFLVIGKLVAQWLVTAVPLLLITVLLSFLFYIPKQGVTALIASLLLGSPVLTIIGAIGCALTLGLQNRGIILVLLVLPLYIPVLIFGAGAVNDAVLNLPIASQLAFLGAFLALAITFAPLAIAAALKISLE
jgi:heme exporter protein B